MLGKPRRYQPGYFREVVSLPCSRTTRTSNSASATLPLGRFDVMDIVESDDLKQIEKAAMLIRAYGRSKTETPLAACGVPSPLCKSIDNICWMEEARIASVVLPSLFEGQVESPRYCKLLHPEFPARNPTDP